MSADQRTDDADLALAFLKLNGKADYNRCREREHYWTTLWLELEGCEHPMLERLRYAAEDAMNRWAELRKSKQPKGNQ